MRQPPLQTRILASAPVNLSAWASALFFGYHFWNGEPVFWALVITVSLLLNVMRADEQVQAYRTWKRAWDAMGDDPLPSGRGGRVGRTLVGLTLIAAFVWYLASQTGRPGYDLALGWLVLGGVAMLVVAILAKWRKVRRARPIKATVVTVVVKGPVLRVPTLAEAYRALPEHCMRIG
jgi:hypothetical protein